MLIADTFMKSLSRLTANEQGLVVGTIGELLVNPSNPGLSAERLNGKDKNFWSCRVGRGMRIIYHNFNGQILLCYVDHHDAAYAWIENRTIQQHPTTGAIQIIQTETQIQTTPSFVYQPPQITLRPLFERYTDQTLMGYGVPEVWLPQIRSLHTEDELLQIVDRLPGEASDALLDLASGRIPQIAVVESNPFTHPDTLRRFFEVKNKEDLELAFIDSWEAWTVFLHPDQRRLVNKQFNGPAKIAGSAGTGKTVVALHRAAEMARRHPDMRILLTTISDPLTRALQQKLRILVANEPHLLNQIEVVSLNQIGIQLYQRVFRQSPQLIDAASVRQIITTATQRFQASIQRTVTITPDFMQREWQDVVDAWQITTQEQYRTFSRLGRTRRLTTTQRSALWGVLDSISGDIRSRNVLTAAQLFQRLTDHYLVHPGPYQVLIVDECQDVTPYQMKFLAALMRTNPSGLFFTGDIGQQIYQAPYSWLGVGVNIIGRAHILRVNYRTSQQIRRRADYLVDAVMRDVDGNEEQRSNTISVFGGPEPMFIAGTTMIDEINQVANWLQPRLNAGIPAHEMCIIVRSAAQIDRARMVAQALNVAHQVVDEHINIHADKLPIMTMQLAKGLEFRAVIVMACDEQILPQYDLLGTYDPAELDAVHASERQLLYVACTRARDELVLSFSGTPSMFLLDMRMP
jgi:superfamily I DNA/RNA helicase/mRNA-degrading endonuclease RelE of RelBE toxin-antitoxin system